MPGEKVGQSQLTVADQSWQTLGSCDGDLLVPKEWQRMVLLSRWTYRKWRRRDLFSGGSGERMEEASETDDPRKGIPWTIPGCNCKGREAQGDSF